MPFLSEGTAFILIGVAAGMSNATIFWSTEIPALLVRAQHHQSVVQPRSLGDPVLVCPPTAYEPDLANGGGHRTTEV